MTIFVRPEVTTASLAQQGLVAGRAGLMPPQLARLARGGAHGGGVRRVVVEGDRDRLNG